MLLSGSIMVLSSVSTAMTSPQNSLAAHVGSGTLDIPIPPAQRWQFAHQFLMFLGAVAVIGAAALLRLDAGGVEAPGGRLLPTLCLWRNALGIDCPGCGLTRAFVALAHGQWRAAWQYNAAAPLLFALVVYQVPFRLVQLVRLRRGLRPHAHSTLVICFLVWGAMAALFAQWAWRIA
jgi:hypothetical protein